MLGIREGARLTLPPYIAALFEGVAFAINEFRRHPFVRPISYVGYIDHCLAGEAEIADDRVNHSLPISLKLYETKLLNQRTKKGEKKRKKREKQTEREKK